MSVEAWTYLLVGLTFASTSTSVTPRGCGRPPGFTWPAGGCPPSPTGPPPPPTGCPPPASSPWRAHLLHGVRRGGLPHGLDGRLRPSGPPPCPLPQEVRQVHRARLHRRPLLLQHRPGGGRHRHHLHLPHLRGGADAGCGHRLQPLPAGGHRHRGHHRGGGGGLLRRAGGHEGITWTRWPSTRC